MTLWEEEEETTEYYLILSEKKMSELKFSNIKGTLLRIFDMIGLKRLFEIDFPFDEGLYQ
jgi:hypothetical protein